MTNTVKIICLGKEFASEEERKAYFRDELRKKLPELKQIEGFPIGDDEDILNLSDPPYYTACPNPWINDFIDEWEQEKSHIKNRRHDFSVDQPYGHDVKEGVNNPVYNAHSYHTKVPHPAIMRFLLHYTQPGDIVLDSFAGTGMCGVAANACENPSTELKYKIETEWRTLFGEMPVWGGRRAIVSDLSPIASFISHNYNTRTDFNQFDSDSDDLFKLVEKECQWMFETSHIGKVKGKINYTVWSECALCPNCNKELIIYDQIVDVESGEVSETFNCPKCKSHLDRSKCEKVHVTYFDSATNTVSSKIKYQPVLINYSVGSKRYKKNPDESDLDRVNKIESLIINEWIPTDEIVKGDKSSDPYRVGIKNVHQFYAKSNLIVLSKFFHQELAPIV